MSKPTIIVAQGAWHGPAHFAPLGEALASHGHKLITPKLPSMHYAELGVPPPSGLGDDIKVLQEALLGELEAHPETDVAVLMHSYGGIPGAAAVENLDKKTRVAAGFRNGVVALLAISSLLISEGISVWDWGGRLVPPSIVVFNVPSPVDSNSMMEISTPNPDPGALALFYHDVPVREAEKYCSILVPQVLSVYYTPIPCPGWKFIPTFYLVAEEDRGLIPMVQRMIVEKADDARLLVNPEGSTIVAESIQSSHSPFLSKTEETAA